MKKNLLFFASDFKIGLSSLLTDQLIAICENCNFETIGVYSENEQENGLEQKLIKNNILREKIIGLDVHRNFLQLAKEICEVIERKNIAVVHVQNNWQFTLIVFIKLFVKRLKML